MKKILSIAAFAALISTSAFAGSFDIHKPGKPEAVKGVEVNVSGKSTRPTVAVQVLEHGVSIEHVTGNVDVANQSVSVNTDIDVTQTASKINVTGKASGLTAAVQVAGAINVRNIGGNVNVANTAVGVNTAIKVGK